MKLVHKDMEHILCWGDGYAVELIIENRRLFFEAVNSISAQAEGSPGDWVLSISDKPVELSRYTDLTVQFAPFQMNRKSLITKLCAYIEERSLLPEYYLKTGEFLGNLEKYIHLLADDLPFEIDLKKMAFGPILRSVCPEVDESGKSTIEKIFEYMELVRELDRDRLFIMVNMRSYFTDEDMEKFIESVCLHDFKLLLLESTSNKKLANTQRYTVDEDLCEF